MIGIAFQRRLGGSCRRTGLCLDFQAILRSISLLCIQISTEIALAATASMTLVAPTLVSDHTRAEARVSIRNPSDSEQLFNLEVYLDSSLGRQSLASTTLSIPAHGQSLHAAWFSTQGLAGTNTIHYRVTSPGAVDIIGESRLTVAATPSRAVPLITAAWLDPGAVLPGVYPQQRPMTAQDVRNEIDAAHALGIDTLIVTYPEYILNGWGSFYPSQNFTSAATFDVVGTIFNQASKNGQHVIVGLGRGSDLYLTWDGFDDAARNAAALAHDTLVANELWELYRHEPSFYGWYLSHEANDIARASQSYYNSAVSMLRRFEADKPVMISPAGTPQVSSGVLNSSAVDVFIYQDAVGAGYVPYRYTYDSLQRISTLDSVYAAYAAAHAGLNKHIWSNLENWEMDGPSYGNAYSANIERILQQLAIEKNYVDVISSYEWFGFAEHPASTVAMGGAAAVSLYNAYRDYYRETVADLRTVNYVVNSGFEPEPSQESSLPNGWSFGGNGDTQRIAYSRDTPTETAAAVNLNIEDASGLPWLYQDVPIQQGTVYQFSVWAKQLLPDPTGGALSAQVWMLANTDSSNILESVALQFSSPDWEYQSTLISAPVGSTLARIVLVAQDSAFGVGTGNYLIDGVALVGPETLFPGDIDQSGIIDGVDLLAWQRGFPFSTEQSDLANWQMTYGDNAARVPISVAEPTSLPFLAVLASMIFSHLRVFKR